MYPQNVISVGIQTNKILLAPLAELICMGARKMTDLTMTDQNAEMDIDRPDIDGPSNRYGH